MRRLQELSKRKKPTDLPRTHGGRRVVTAYQRALAASLSPIQVLLLITLTALMVSKVWQRHIWVDLGLVSVAGAAWFPELRRVGTRRWWFLYVVGIFIYTVLRSYADNLGFPLHADYPIRFDRLLFGGQVSVIALQDTWFSPARLTALDWLTVLTHWSFFVAPHAAAIGVFIWKRTLFPSYTLAIVGTMYLGLVVFVLLPTSPPWLAAQTGSLPEVFRILDFAGSRVGADRYSSLYASLGAPNAVAAVPSIHMAITFALYLFARDHYRKWAPAALVYVAAMGFSLLYLGEHYVLDLLVGMGCASIAYLAARRFCNARAQSRMTNPRI